MFCSSYGDFSIWMWKEATWNNYHYPIRWLVGWLVFPQQSSLREIVNRSSFKELQFVSVSAVIQNPKVFCLPCLSFLAIVVGVVVVVVVFLQPGDYNLPTETETKNVCVSCLIPSRNAMLLQTAVPVFFGLESQSSYLVFLFLFVFACV